MALDATQVQKVRNTLTTSGWIEVMRPILLERGRALTKMAMSMPSERPEPYKDMDDRDAMNLIRGRTAEIEWVISAFANEVAVFDHNRRLDELDRQQANGLEPAAGANPAQPA